MKRIFCIILAIILTFSLCACGTASPKSVTSDLFKAIQNKDEKLLDKIYLGEMGENSIIPELLEIIEESECAGKLGDALSKSFLNFNYSINNIEEDGDDAIAHVTITTENWAEVLPKVGVLIATKSITMALDGASEKKIEKECKEILEEQKKKIDDVEFDIDVKLKKDDGKWKIDLSDKADDLLKALSGGLY